MTYKLLNDIRVIESSAFVAAPIAGLTLAQFGADVIRIDMIGGGLDYARLPRLANRRSLYWTGLNKGKRSIALNLKHPEGKEIARQLVVAPGTDSGVLLTNIATSWLCHDSLKSQRPDLISCTITGNSDGSTALDYTVNCATGYPTMTGNGSIQNPINHALPAWDLVCGYQAAMSTIAAVLRRKATGLGAEIKIALSDCAFTTLSHLGLMAEAELTGQNRPSIGNNLYGAFGRDFACSDGVRIMVAAISLNQWQSLVRACGIHDAIDQLEKRLGANFSDEAQRYEAHNEIAKLIVPWFSERTYEVAARELSQAHVCWGKYGTVVDLINQDSRVDPQVNPVFERIVTPGIGEHRVAGATPVFLNEPRDKVLPAPLLGTHTDEILSSILGLPSGEIGRLHDQGIVASSDKDPSLLNH